MSVKCVIVFDENVNKVYYGGQLLKGTVLLTLTKDQPVKGIYIEVTGSAKCRWCEHVQQKRMTYRGGEVYLSAKKYFLGSDDSNSTLLLLKGEHVYSFTCPLSATLPTSFEGTYGSIRYKADVTMNIPLWPDKSFSEGFTVIKSLDLNGLGDVRAPVLVDRTEMYSVWCCCPFIKSQPISCLVSLPKSGFTPGQHIGIRIDVDNNSNHNINAMTVCLLRIVVYFATERGNHHKTEHVRYSEVRTIGCKKKSTENILADLKVPPGPPSDAASSSVCKIRYEVEIRTDIGQCHAFPSIRIPVIIGTFPLLEQPVELDHNDPRISVVSYDSDLPSYEQAMAMNENNELIYAPVYPIYEPTADDALNEET